jgi:hypothetical protein
MFIATTCGVDRVGFPGAVPHGIADEQFVGLALEGVLEQNDDPILWRLQTIRSDRSTVEQNLGSSRHRTHGAGHPA